MNFLYSVLRKIDLQPCLSLVESKSNTRMRTGNNYFRVNKRFSFLVYCKKGCTYANYRQFFSNLGKQL